MSIDANAAIARGTASEESQEKRMEKNPGGGEACEDCK